MNRIPSYAFIFGLLLTLRGISVSLSQTVTPPDTIKESPSGVDTVVTYSASDSITYSLSSRVMKLFGKGNVKYRKIELNSERIEMNWATSTLHARGVPDSADTTGKKYTGNPILIDGGEQYKGETISYNFRTQKGKITLGETKIEQGYYWGEGIKRVGKDVLFVESGRYTTCEKGDPHYYFSSPRMKIILKDKVIAAPIYLYIGGVPVFAVPFGVFPNQSGRRSGIIAPAYGDDFRRGRYITNLGYYWAMSDYTDLRTTLDWYSRGGWVARSTFRYALRYRFSGSLSANFTNTHFGEKFDPDRTEQREYNIRIAHNQQFNPTTRMDVDFTFTSGSYYRNTSTNLADLLRQNVISNATLYKTWKGSNSSLTINLYRDQNLQTDELTERLPSISFTKGQTFPFRRRQPGGGEQPKWYELIAFGYSGQGLNVINKRNVFVSNLPGSKTIQRDERQGVSHTLTINASPRISEFSVTPFINYSELWYTKSIRKRNFISSRGTDSLVTEDVKGFRAVRFFNVGVSTSTKLYGIFPINALGIGSVRHTVTPSISYSYQPDFGKPNFGYWGTYQTSTGQVVPYSFYEREPFGGAPRGELQSMSLSVGHLFEMKTAIRDTSDREKKIQLLNLTTSVFYNFAADSMKLSELVVSYRTNIGNLLDISGGSSFNFYKFDPVARRRINKFLVSEGEGLAQLTSFSINLSTSLRGGQRASVAQPRFGPPSDRETGQYSESPAARPEFSIPWNLSLAFDYFLSRTDPTMTSRSSNVRGSLNFNLTQNWRISASLNYDVISKQVAAPVINIYRDLHCWEMIFDWLPRGIYRGFKLEIRVKAPHLQDLKLTKQGSVRSIY